MDISRSAVIAVILVMFVSVQGIAQERRIKRSELSPAVEKTVKAQSQGATIRGFSEEKEKGQIYCEVELTVAGNRKDVLIDGGGAIVEVEQAVVIDALPPAVWVGLQAKAGRGKLLEVESITKHDKLVAYEAQVMSDGKRFEVQVGLHGESLNNEQ